MAICLMRRTMLIAFTLLAFSVNAEVLFKDGFEPYPVFGKTTLPGWDGPAAPSIMYVTNAQKSGGTKSLQLDYLQYNREGSTYMYGWLPRSTKDIYVHWHQRWSANYKFGTICNKFMKISQYKSGAANKGGGEFIPETSWGSNQLIVGGLIMKEANANGVWGNLSYSQNVGAPVGFERERWYCIQVHVKWNTPGMKDGIVEAWIDGVKKINHTGREFIGSGPSDCNQQGCYSHLSEFDYIMVTGNRCVMDGMTATENSWYDDIEVSTSYVAHGTSGLATATEREGNGAGDLKTTAFANRLVFTSGFANGGNFSIRAFDSQGRQVWSSSGETAGGRAGQTVWNHGGKLQRGVYLIRGEQNGHVMTTSYCHVW